MARTCKEGWETVVEQFHASGVSKTAFAQRRGIPLATLRRWIERAATVPKSGPPPMLPVRAVSATSVLPRPSPQTLRAPWVEVALRDGVVVRCVVGTDVGYVAALVERMR